MPLVWGHAEAECPGAMSAVASKFGLSFQCMYNWENYWGFFPKTDVDAVTRVLSHMFLKLNGSEMHH